MPPRWNPWPGPPAPLDLTKPAVLAEVLRLQRAAYAVEAARIGDDRIPPLHETAEQLRTAGLHWLGVPSGATAAHAAAHTAQHTAQHTQHAAPAAGLATAERTVRHSDPHAAAHAAGGPEPGPTAGIDAGRDDDPAPLAAAVAWSVDGSLLDLHRLVVDPVHARRGLGRALVAHLLDAHPDRPAVVSTGRGNLPARRLYEGLGFTEAGTVEVLPGLQVVRYELVR